MANAFCMSQDDDDMTATGATRATQISTTSSTATTTTTTMSTTTSSPPSSSPSFFRTVTTICVWYCLSNAIILSTKWIFKTYFPYPLTVTTYSNILSSILAALLTKILPQEPLSRTQFTKYVLPIGIMTAIEIGCSNFALELLTVSFGTILKGMAPIFTFGWGLLFGLESFKWEICACLLTMAFGIVLASMGEGHEFQLWGFLLQLLSTCLGGLRWATTHKLLLEGQESGNQQHHHMSPLKATLYTAPTTSICILPVAFAMEGANVWKRELNDGLQEALIVFATITVIATLVFCLIMSEYWLVGVTSSLALSVAGVFKELLTVGAGILIFAETIDFLNVLGFAICQVGIVAYVYLRYDGSVAYTPIEGENSQQRQRHGSPQELTRFNNLVQHDDSPESFDDEAENLEMPKVRHRLNV